MTVTAREVHIVVATDEDGDVTLRGIYRQRGRAERGALDILRSEDPASVPEQPVFRSWGELIDARGQQTNIYVYSGAPE